MRNGSDWPLQLRAVNTFFLTAYLTWVLCILGVLRRLGYTRLIALSVTLVAALTLPMAAFPFQFYPEVVAGILVVTAAGYVLRPSGGSALSVLTGVAAGYLPWLHVRFSGLTIVLAIAAGVALRREPRRLWGFAVGLGIVLACLSLYVYRVTGSVVPTALWTTSDTYAPLSGAFAARGSWAYVLDRHWGVLAQAPVYLVALPGYWCLERRWRGAGWLCALLQAALIVPAAGHSLTGAETTPGRLVAAVVPLAAIPMAEVATQYRGWRPAIAMSALLVVLSLDNALAYNLHHMKHYGPLVDWSFSGWKAQLLFPVVAQRQPWEMFTANGWLLVGWLVLLGGLVGSPVVMSKCRLRNRGTAVADRGRSTGACALVGALVFLVGGTIIAVRIGPSGLARYRVPSEAAAMEAAELLDRNGHCAICATSTRGVIGTEAVRERLVDFGVGRRLCGGQVAVRLQAANGLYLRAQGRRTNVGRSAGRRVRILANGETADAGEAFTLSDANGGCVESGDVVFLRSSNGYYLRARQGGGGRVDAGGVSTGPEERFVVISGSQDTVIRNGDAVSLRATSGHYLAARRGGGGAVNARRENRARGAYFVLSLVE